MQKRGVTPCSKSICKKYRFWADIIEESQTFILAKDIDGVNVYVAKDGLQLVRDKK